jgi:hypothetical protein
MAAIARKTDKMGGLGGEWNYVGGYSIDYRWMRGGE